MISRWTIFSEEDMDMDEKNGFNDGWKTEETSADVNEPVNAGNINTGNNEINDASAHADKPASSGPIPVDYSVAAGTREVIGRAPTMAYNTSDRVQQNDKQEQPHVSYETASASGAQQSSAENTYSAPFTETAADAGFEQTEQPSNSYDNVVFGDGNNDGGIGGEKPKKFKKPRKPMTPKTKRIIAFVLAVFLCGGAGFGGGALAVKCFSPSYSGGTQTIKIDASDAESLNAASAIAKKVMPSVVGISTVSQTYTQTIFGLQQGTQQGVGTGLIVTEDGYILTNSHVVNDGESESITVDLYDGSEYKGTVLWNSSDLDLAIVKIDAKGLTAAELGDSDNVEIGDYAVAIGNPLGLNFERSVTQGIISGLDRTITTSDSSTGNQNTMEGLIQTDASINSGNSGGPLINSNGQVIGINTAKASSAEGLGFAIPVNTAMPIINEIKENGTYEQSYIGISGMNVEAVKAQYQTDFNAEKGIYVVQIYTNSPAAKAGLQEGDIITAIDGTKVEDMSDLKKELVKYRPGDTVNITYERSKQNKTVQVTLAAQSESTQQSLQPAEQDSNSSSGNSGNGSGSYMNPYDFFGGYLN